MLTKIKIDMNKSPLNHNQPRGNTGQNNPNALNSVRTLAKKGGIHGALGKLALQQSGGDAINNANAMQNEALNNVENTGVVNPIDIQKNQVAEASGLTALTEGPASAGSSIIPQKPGTLADQQYNTILGGLGSNSSFANKSPLKLAEVNSKPFSEYGGPYSQGGDQGVFMPDSDNDGISDDTEAVVDTANSLSQNAYNIISSAQNNKGKEKTTRKQRIQSKIDSTDNPAKKERMKGRLERINMRQEGRAARGEKKNELKGKFVQGIQDFKNKLWDVEVNDETEEIHKRDFNKSLGIGQV